MNTQAPLYDVAVVGASLAGASLAIRLGQAGIRCLLVDKASFPRRKACGEGLSSTGLDLLAELGVRDRVLAGPHHQFSGYTIHSASQQLEIPFTKAFSGVSSGIGIQRMLLDNLLIERARELPSVTTVLGTAVKTIVDDGNLWNLRVGPSSYAARYLVLADGPNSALASRLGVPVKRRSAGRYGYSMILQGKYTAPLAHVVIALQVDEKKEAELICTPISENRLNVCVLGSKRAIALAAKDQLSVGISEEILRVTGFSGEMVDRPLGLGPLGHMSREAFFGRALLVGDCCETFDPIGGMGMTHALASAKLAAESLLRVHRPAESHQNYQIAFAEYGRAREKMARALRGFTRITYFSLKKLGGSRIFSRLGRLGVPQAIGQSINASTLQGTLSAGLARMLLEIVGSI